jgi:DNA repair protein RadA/Sms
MPKSQVIFFCSACGYESPKWLGRCPGCDAWNSFSEAPRPPKSDVARRVRSGTSPAITVRLADVDVTDVRRIATGIANLDELLGGGLVPGSVTLLAGTPGIGKSTLALRMLDALAADIPVLYCCAEESAAQTRLRAARLGASDRIFLVATTDVSHVLAAAESTRPALLVVDSIQSVSLPDVEGAPGSVNQVRESALSLTRFAKESGCAVVMVGHVTKDGAIAGPKTLEHLVDTVLYFEGERLGAHRILRATKNRFGATDDVCVFSMGEGGLREVRNPSQVFLSERPAAAAGSVVLATMNGARPLLVEIQALVSSAGYGTPRRLVSGLDYNRVCMVVAVLERRLGMRLADQDVYASVVGGMRVSEPASDLAVALSIASAFRNRPVGDDVVCFGEVGLTGELRSVGGAAQRLAEAAKLGFRRAIAPSGTRPSGRAGDLQQIPVATLAQAIAAALD